MTSGKGMLLILSGPSGVGKGTLAKMLLEWDPSFRLSCSVTTREPREGEQEGIDYHFISNEKYDELLEKDAFLEHAQVHGNRYGTLRKPVEDLIAQGMSVLLEIDQQGAIHVMEKARDYVSIFILPPSLEELRSRLEGRGTETPEAVERRLANARGEIEKLDRYQYALVNDHLEEAFQRLQAIVTAEKMRVTRFYYKV